MADITTGLIAYWGFDDGAGTIATDYSGNGYNGILAGSPVWVQGKINGALQGNNSSVTATFAFAPTNFSVAFWINPSILANYNNWIGNSWGAFVIHTTSEGAIYCGTDVYTRIGPTQDGIYVVNQWAHMAFTFNAGVGTLYKNGVVIASKSGMSNSAAWTNFTIGVGSNLCAKIDDVRVYSRALTQDDITALFNYVTTTTTTTTTPTTITFSSALSGGYVSSPNSITAYGVCYSATNSTPSLTDSYTVDGTLNNSYINFTSQLTGLKSSTTYYVRSYATQSDNTTFYGNMMTFATLPYGIVINSLGILIDKGTIPPINNFHAKINTIGLVIDKGTIPPKNYFHAKINTIGIGIDQAGVVESILYFQIL
jgi:hypothetical protein